MRNRSARPLTACLFIAAIHLAASLAFIVVFKRTFEYRLLIIPLHTGLVGVLMCAITLFMGILVSFARFREWRVARFVIAVIPATASTFLIVLYIVDCATNVNYGANVTFRIALAFLPQFRSLIEALWFPAWWVYVPTILLPVCMFGLYFALSKTMLAGLEELFAPGRPFSLFKNRFRGVLSSVVLIGVLVAFVAFMAKTLPSGRHFWFGEPIVGLFKLPPDFGDDPHKVEIAEKDRVIRAQYPKDAPFERKNVFMIMSDSLRADHMQVYGYERPTTPFLASLQQKGWLRTVKFSMSTCSESVCGVMSTMASRHFSGISYYNFKLNDLLRDLGYRIYFIGGGDHTTWYGFRGMIGRSIDFFFDGLCSEKYAVNDDNLLLEGLEQVPDFDGTPALVFLFLMSTHDVGVKFEEFNVYKPSKVDWHALATGGYDRQTMTNRYDNGVLQADAFLERIFAALDDKGYLDNSLAVILADHANGIGERGNYGHGEYIYQEDINIPIIIYDDPDIEYANLEFAAQVDVAPTIVERLGLPIPSSWEGRSLLDPDIKSYSYHTTSYHASRKNVNNSRAVIYRTQNAIYKYLRWDPMGGQPAREELYELISDPGERNDLMAAAAPELIRHLKQKMAEEFRTQID